jgi:hypothetical protein
MMVGTTMCLNLPKARFLPPNGPGPTRSRNLNVTLMSTKSQHCKMRWMAPHQSRDPAQRTKISRMLPTAKAHGQQGHECATG